MKEKLKPLAETAPLGIVKLIFLSIFSTCILYNVYYLLAPWIWSQNIVYPPEKLAPWMRVWLHERDGIEIYALYIFMFVNIIMVFSLVQVWRLVSRPIVNYGLMLVLAAISVWYGLSVKFVPPMSGVNANGGLFFCIAVAALLVGLYFREKVPASSGILITVLALIPVCFISISPISAMDYSYIFLPAQKLIDGFAISDIYFQYDALLSFLAVVWIKLGFTIWQFQFLGQLSYFAAILTIYLFSRKLFHQKSLSFLLLCSLILVRMYASPWDVSLCFQVTPLRLDLWLVLFVMIYFLGAFHWSIGLVCGLMAIFHKSFGTIHAMAYLQLILTLGVIHVLDSRKAAGKIEFGSIFGYLKKAAVPLALVILSLGVSAILFSKNANITSYYQKIGIGFIPITKTSFYWYYPIVISAVFSLLCILRGQASVRYIALGFLLLYCTIGNSIYFFGRSHEHNILNISISLVFLFFYGLDLIDRKLSDSSAAASGGFRWRKHVVACVGILFIASVAYFYSGNITKRLNIQSAKLALPFRQDAACTECDTAWVADLLQDIKSVTNDSKNVQIMAFESYSEYLLYHCGKYKDMYFFSPTTSWIFMDDLTQYIQGSVDAGDYILLPAEAYRTYYSVKLSNVGWVYQTRNKGYVLIAARGDASVLRSK
jgi:hypothetical protein